MEIIQLYKYPESWSPLWIITNLITCLIEVCTNILDHLSGSLLQDKTGRGLFGDSSGIVARHPKTLHGY